MKDLWMEKLVFKRFICNEGSGFLDKIRYADKSSIELIKLIKAHDLRDIIKSKNITIIVFYVCLQIKTKIIIFRLLHPRVQLLMVSE